METERLTEVVTLRLTPSTLDALLAIGQAQPVQADVAQVIRTAIAQFIAAQPVGATSREATEAARVD